MYNVHTIFRERENEQKTDKLREHKTKECLWMVQAMANIFASKVGKVGFINIFDFPSLLIRLNISTTNLYIQVFIFCYLFSFN